MNFLQLCNTVIQRASITDTSLTTVTGLRGELAKIPLWVNDANKDIERLHQWPWKRVNKTFQTSPDKYSYPPSELLITDIKSWDLRPFKSRLYLDDTTNEAHLKPITYEEWERYYAVGNYPSNRPYLIYEDRSDKTLRFHPTPDDMYVVNVSYWQSPVDMVASTDTPLMDDDFHEIIVHKALIDYAVSDEASEVYRHALNRYIKLLNQMEEQLEPVKVLYQPVA